MCGIPGAPPPARGAIDGRSGISPPWALALVLLFLFSSPTIARSDPFPPPRVVRSEPTARAQQELTRAFEEAMQ